jgi:hypothetical protein
MDPEYYYNTVNDTELDELLAGRPAGVPVAWSRWTIHPPSSPGFTGVIWTRGPHPDDPVHPLAIITRDDDIRRLCGRYAQLRSDLSPLTAWCHLLTPQSFEHLDSLVQRPNLGGMEAAWTGLIVAEATLLAEKPLASIRIQACLATRSFAIARSKALWKNVLLQDITTKFELANRLGRNDGISQKVESRGGKVRSALQAIWHCLTELSFEHVERTSEPRNDVGQVLSALRALRDARLESDPQEARRLALPLLPVLPEAHALEQLADLAPEMRLRAFDNVVDALNKTNPQRDQVRQIGLALIAGYLATVAAGGSPSLTLAENNANRWPEITAWAYLVGGIGERIIWTSSFDGLGRLVARELMRPLRLDEPPACDFALDEAVALIDPKLQNPLVHLKVKQARIATVAILPGVNIPISAADSALQEQPKQQPLERVRVTQNASSKTPESRDIFAALADAIWPHLQPRVEDCIGAPDEEQTSRQSAGGFQTGHRGRRTAGSQSVLPLKDSRR